MKKIDLQKGINLIGVMSGTSLDGLDMCYANFKYDGKSWSYKSIVAEDEEYPADLKNKLAGAQNMSALEYARLNSDYGLYLGQRLKAFIERNKIEKRDIAAIASHGQTIFHQPEVKFTAQIGSGAGIAATVGVDCICDFRTTDVALGGQGAPLVPIGDRHLFGTFDYCLNLGGFSNISSEGKNGHRRAFDISPVNYVLNFYTRQKGLEFDRDGLIARSGKVCKELLNRLNNLLFYTQKGPKSLGREWVENEVIPLIESAKNEAGGPLAFEDKLATFCEHTATQISRNIASVKGYVSKVLVTGGGALNKYLIERMQALTPQCKYVVPDLITVKFKEALIFAFLGALYLADMPSCMSSVTGALRDNIGGALYKGDIL